jgi:hypothetical protein
MIERRGEWKSGGRRKYNKMENRGHKARIDKKDKKGGGIIKREKVGGDIKKECS